MAKIYPHSLSPPPLSSTSMMSRSREVYTIWMKSLVMNGHGCTVFDSDGRMVYRVDNYDCKSSDEVYLMDREGKTLFKILRKKLRVFGRWEGYRCSDLAEEEEQPWFRVRRAARILKNNPSCDTTVTVRCTMGNPCCYKIHRSEHNKSAYKINDMDGRLVAEVKRKHTTCGVILGEDVLSLVVEPNVDHLLIMGLVIVCGLINHNM